MNTKIILNKIKFTKIFAPPIQLNRRKLTLDRTGHFQCFGKLQTKAYLGIDWVVRERCKAMNKGSRATTDNPHIPRLLILVYLIDHYHRT